MQRASCRAAGREGAKERGSALVIVLLVILALVGMGIVAIQQTRTQMSTAGNQRVSRQAYEAAYAGLVRFTEGLAQGTGPMVITALQSAEGQTLVFNEDQSTSSPLGVFPAPVALADDDRDAARVGRREYMIVLSRPRQADPVPGTTQAGANELNIKYWVVQADVYGWVNRQDGTFLAQPGAGSARKVIRAEIVVSN